MSVSPLFGQLKTNRELGYECYGVIIGNYFFPSSVEHELLCQNSNIMLWGKVEDTGHLGRADGSSEVNIQGPHHCTKSALLRTIRPGPGTISSESERGLVIFFYLQAV